MGTPLGKDCYKIRLAVKSKGKGKSGGVRIITHLIAKIEMNETGVVKVYMAYIYDKSDFENISQKDISKMINELKENQ